MNRISKKTVSLLLALILLVSIIPTGIINAYAFSPRTTAPKTTDKWYSTYYSSGAGNCVKYVKARASEILGEDYSHYLASDGNNGGTNWWNTTTKLPKGQVPKAGAIICWGSHVAVVERVNSNNTIEFSEGNSYTRAKNGETTKNVELGSSGTFFDYRYNIKVNNGRPSGGSRYSGTSQDDFLGYIYLKDAGTVLPPPENNSVNKKVDKVQTDPQKPKYNYYNANSRYDIGMYHCVYKQGVNMRSGPGTQNSKIGSVPYNWDIYVWQTDANWGYGRFAGKEGWVCLDYFTKVSIPVPSTPSISSISSGDIAKGKTVTIYWNGVSGADGYRVAVRGAETKDIDVGNVTSFTYRLDQAASYNFHVQAYNVSGSSSWSGSRSCTAHNPVTVKFVDWDNAELTKVTIDYGSSATAPASPSRKGYTFQGWNDSYYNVTTDKTIKATYKIITYTVNFFDREGTLIVSRKVDYGHDATPPEDTHETSKYKFQGWNSTDYINVYTDRADKNINIDGVYSWYNYDLPTDCTITSATRQFAGYNVVFDIENNDIYPTTGRAVVALKTTEGKLVEMTESTAFSIPAGKTKNGLEVFVPCTKPAAMVEVFMVSNYSSGVPISPSVTSSITEGLMYEDSVVRPANEDGTLDIQEVTQYKFRDKEFTTGNSKSMTGWEWDNTKNAIPVSETGYQDSVMNLYDDDTGKRELIGTRTVDVYGTRTKYEYYHYRNYGKGSDHVLCPVDHGGASYHYFQTYTPLACNGYSTCNGSPRYGNAVCPYGCANKDVNNMCWWQKSWQESYVSHQKQQYNYKTYKYTYNFYRWKEWSEWSDTQPASSSNRQIEDRIVYRYKSNVELPEDNSGQERTISGNVDTAFAGKQITLSVYGYTGASDYTNEYIGQSIVGNDGSYSFTFKLREEPTEKTGDFTVAIGIEGTSDATIIDTIEAPKPSYTVNFYDWYGNIIDTQIVEEGENATLPEAPEKEGYDFIGWDKSITNIKEDTDVFADYEKQKFTVVFVDWENQQIEVRNFNYGDGLQTPDFATVEGYTFKGWDAILNGTTSVTQNMIVAAVYEANEYNIEFYDWDGNVVETQKVKFGDSAIAADDIEEEGMNFTGWLNPEDYQNVTHDAAIYPSYYFDETTETPAVNYETGEYAENLRLSLSSTDENAVIFYYLNDDVTTEAIYTKPLTIDKTCSITYYATSFGKNDSDKVTKYYCINKSGEPSDWMPYDDLPQEVKDNPGDYALEQESGYSYKDTTQTSSVTEANELEYNDWQQESDAYTEYSDWQDEGIEIDDSLIGYEVDTQEVPDTTKSRYQYSHYKYVEDGETKYAKSAVDGFDCEYEEIIVDSRLSIAGFTDDNVSYYAYNGEPWFTQIKVSGIKTQYRSRYKVLTYYRWTGWSIETPSSEEQREYKEEEVYRYADKNYHLVNVVQGNSDMYKTYIVEEDTQFDVRELELYGYTFEAAYLDEAYSEQFDITTAITESLTLYISYTPNIYTVTFQMQDGSEIDTQSVNYLDAAVEPETDAVPGWVFVGWDKEFDCITEDTVVTGSYVKKSEYAYVSLDRNTANMYQGNTLKLNATITPNNLVDEQLEWSSSDTGVATVDDNGNVTAVNEGTATITVRVVKTKESAECKLVIKADADHYLVLANNSTLNYDSLGYLRRIALGTKAEDVAKEFTNPLSDIKIFGMNGSELTSSKVVGTGSQIKLYNGDAVTDTRTIIITGDMTGDGVINNRDVAMFNRYLVNKVTVEDYQALAVDVNGDGYINNRDAAMIARYLVGKDHF